MATIRGEEGSVEFINTGGEESNAPVVGTRSWSLTVTKESLDTSVHGDTFRTFVGSMVSGSGTVELVFDNGQASQTTFIEDALTTGDTADATFEFFTTGTQDDNDSIKGTCIITDMEITSTVGELVTVSCNFITSGAVTSNL